MKEQLAEIIKSDGLKDITFDLIENALDDSISNDVIKEIPVLKSIYSLGKIFNSITDRIFIKKAMNVLLELGDINPQQREKLISDLDDKNEKGSEKILMAIDKLETTRKCIVFGRLCKLKALDKIGKDDFLRLTKLIQDAYLDDLILITDFVKGKGEKIHEGDYWSIISLGLIYQEPSEQEPITRHNPSNEYEPEFVGGEIEFNYYLSYLGEILLENYGDLFTENFKRQITFERDLN